MEELGSKYDLTSSVSKFLDDHFVLLVIKFLGERDFNNKNQKNLAIFKLNVLQKTNRHEDTIKMYKEINETETVPKEMLEKNSKFLKQFDNWLKLSKPIIELLPKIVNPKKDTSIEQLKKENNITEENVNSLLQYSRGLYGRGDYLTSLEYLKITQLLCSEESLKLEIQWGKVACLLLLPNERERLPLEFETLRTLVDKSRKNKSKKKILQEKTWLLHWALCYYFTSDEKSASQFVDKFFYEHYVEVISSICPYLLRYLVISTFLHSKRKNYTRDLARLIKQQRPYYSDPITEVVYQIYITSDLEKAQEMYEQAIKVMTGDFFLHRFIEKFTYGVRASIFESFCRIHRSFYASEFSNLIKVNEDFAKKFMNGHAKLLAMELTYGQDNLVKAGSQNTIRRQFNTRTRYQNQRFENMDQTIQNFEILRSEKLEQEKNQQKKKKKKKQVEFLLLIYFRILKFFYIFIFIFIFSVYDLKKVKKITNVYYLLNEIRNI
ncbi:eukaryotic translation initiation factor 3 subunit e [Anaeramoeba flamelloides]|uniref:Eukaryotic translation initiation factor 3 subunit e n=1 Tax=Anaeramoeba flamelloides TaxID=1746091 RepID=A0AAV8AJP3_9EUKA|nr:eukaryotic translation initiation factor 3 subunit e [Anaeramoeba flamelloides]